MIYKNLDPESPRNFRDILRWTIERRRLPAPPPERAQPPAVVANDGRSLRTGQNTITWVGHATVVLQLDGQTVLCDPVWSQALPGFIPRLSQPGLELAAVPRPDAVLISHNHYDHLDMPTLRRLGSDIQLFVPAGLRGFLRSRGFRRVHEFDWWSSNRLGSLEITFVPAQHWSRRLPWDTNRSWWGGWMIEGSQQVYFAGDSGFFSGFELIHQRFPSIDWAILPIGAYDPRWFMQPVHMNPEEAGQAFTILQAERFLPIHYGTFRLTDEPLGDPPVRLKAWWEAQALAPERLAMPRLGETLLLDRVPVVQLG